MLEFVSLIVIIAIALLLFRGAVRTFQRSVILALFLIILLPPIWISWAIVESFIPSSKN